MDTSESRPVTLLKPEEFAAVSALNADELKAWLRMRLTPSQIAALTVYGEARNQSLSGVQGVLSVMRNRVDSGRWGKNWLDVALAPKQFSCWNDNDPNCHMLLQLGLQVVTVNDGDSINPVFDGCFFMALRMVHKDYRDNTMGSTHYFAPSVVDMPDWARPPAIYRTTIGAHAFYSNVS